MPQARLFGRDLEPVRWALVYAYAALGIMLAG